jgi:hypothetical protein
MEHIVALSLLVIGAVLAVNRIPDVGVVMALTAANAGGDSFPNTGGGGEYVHIKAGATPVTVTFVAQGNCSQGFLHNRSVTVAANTERKIGGFQDIKRWNDANNRVQMTYDQVATITIGAFSS